MGHPIHRIKAFEIAGPYRLRIEFGDGVVRTIDFRPILEGALYGRGGCGQASRSSPSIGPIRMSELSKESFSSRRCPTVKRVRG